MEEMIFMSESSEVEKQIKCKFRKALRENAGGNVVDELISILKEDYILLAKKRCSCLDCIHHEELRHTIPSHYCNTFNSFIGDFNKAYNCDEYFSGKGEARKSIARFHNELTGEWIVE